MQNPIPTFRQYVAADRSRVTAEYGVPAAEVARLYPDHMYRGKWWSHVVEAFNAGRDFTPQGIVTLTTAQLRDLSRTSRGLRHGLPTSYLYRAQKLALKAA